MYGENGLNTKHRSERRRNEENRVIPAAVYEHRSRRRPVGPASRIESAPEIESTTEMHGALDSGALSIRPARTRGATVARR